jgi:hypothetical protein
VAHDKEQQNETNAQEPPKDKYPFQDLSNKRTFKQKLHSFVKPESNQPNPLPTTVILLEIGISQTDNSL